MRCTSISFALFINTYWCQIARYAYYKMSTRENNMSWALAWFVNYIKPFKFIWLPRIRRYLLMRLPASASWHQFRRLLFTIGALYLQLIGNTMTALKPLKTESGNTTSLYILHFKDERLLISFEFVATSPICPISFWSTLDSRAVIPAATMQMRRPPFGGHDDGASGLIAPRVHLPEVFILAVRVLNAVMLY